MYLLVNSIFYTILVGILSIFALKEKTNRKSFALLLLAIFGNEIITRITMFFPDVQFFHGYNWIGKSLATLFCIIFILIYNDKYEFGFTFRQKAGSLKPVLIVSIALLIVELILLWFTAGPRQISLESYLFQLSVPGISEEIAYRGLFLGLLNAMFVGRKKIFGAPIGFGAAIITLLFIGVHIMGFNSNLDFYFHFNIWTLISLVLPPLVMVWQRERSGSILIPVIFHNLLNTLMFLIPSIKFLMNQ